MVKYINLSFDYETIYEKDWSPYVSNDIVSSWWTGRIEFLDDAFFYKNWSCVSAIVWSWKSKESLFFWNWNFSVQRTNGLEKKFYKDFWTAKNINECEMVWGLYNEKLFQFALRSIEKLTKYRKKRWLDAIVYDFVHTPTSWLTVWAAKKLSKHLGINLVSSLHVDENEIQALKWNQYPRADFILEKDKEIRTDSDCIIVKNKSLYNQIYQINHNCIYIGNDLNFPVYNDKILLKKNPNIILYVWRVSYAKWFDRFAQMVDKINSKENNYKFIICWEIWDNGDILNHINNLKRYNNVYFEWHVGRTAIQDAFLEAGTLILPSRTEVYNQTIMEALFYGCNVICSDVWAAKEQIWNCKSAYILANDNDFVDNSLKMLCNINNSYEKSKTAYQYANRKFNSNICRGNKMNFLNKMFWEKNNFKKIFEKSFTLINNIKNKYTYRNIFLKPDFILK